MKRAPKSVLVRVLGVSALLAAGGSMQHASAASSPTTMGISTLPFVDSAPYYLAVQRGYFTAAGITVSTHSRSGEGTVVTSLVNGTDKCGFAGTAAMLQAAEKGLPIQIVGQLTKITTKPAEDTGLVLVKGSSTIKTVKDLAGKTVAVGSLKSGGELSLRAAVDIQGGDSKTLKIIEIPLPNMATALESGQVDAISTISPFDGPAMAKGARQILSPGAVAAPDTMQLGVACGTKFIKNNGATLSKFLGALNKATNDIAANPDLAKQVLPSFSPVPADVIKAIKLPVFSSQVSSTGVQRWVDMMVKYGFINKALPFDRVFLKAS